MRQSSIVLLCLALWPGLLPPGSRAAQPAPTISLFDGRSFAGWQAPDMSWWTIEEGAITGRITREHPCSTNQYLVWQGGELADFELTLRSRVNGDGAINNGFQFRSRLLPDGDVAGYQVDNNLLTDWLVRLYDEFGRHTLAYRGKRTVFDPLGTPTTTDLKDAAGPAWFRLENWHEYHLICRGPSLTLSVDGRLVAEVEDHDRTRADARGILALQLHSGPPTVVQFKDIRLRILRPASALREPRWTRAESGRRRQSIVAAASGFWDLGTGGHGAAPPLRAVGDSEFDVRADGPGAARGATVATLRDAWFDGGTNTSISGPGLTCYVRARVPSGIWDRALLSKYRPGDQAGFTFLTAQNDEIPGPELAFFVHAAAGYAQVGFPAAAVPPGAWHSFVGRYDGRHLEILCDGEIMARRAWEGGALGESHAPLLVGANGVTGKPTQPFNGQIQEAGLWRRALSDAELAALARVREIRVSPSAR